MSTKLIKPKKISKKEIVSLPKTQAKVGRYYEAVGRRKTAVARVRVFPGGPRESGVPEVFVNEKPLSAYFVKKQGNVVLSPFKELSLDGHKVSAKVYGGGKNAQAEAIRLGISRALIDLNNVWRSRLKRAGFLRRDPRMVERKKYGLRKARRPQQWRKR